MDKNRVKNILIRATNWIGDAVLTTPAITAIQQTFPGARITVLAKPPVAELFLGNPYIHEVLIYQNRGRHQGVLGKLRLIMDLRKKHFDLAILLQNAFEAALLTFLSGIPQRYGYATDGRAWLLTCPVPVQKAAREKHQRDYYLELLIPLGAAVRSKSLVFVVSPDEEKEAWDRLKQNHIQRSDLIVGVNPGSTYGTAKRWAPERFAELMERLTAELGAKVLIFGGPEETVLAKEIFDRMKQKPILFTGQTSIRQLTALIKQCRLFVTNDTGPMHVANALGVPIVAIFGSTNPKTTSPAQSGFRLVRKGVSCSPCLLRTCPIDHRCMDWITVEEVYWAIRQELADDKPLPIAVFLDRDGTLNTGGPYLDKAENLCLFEGVGRAIARLNAQRLHAVVVTNQSGVARDYFSETSLNTIHQKLEELLLLDGAHLDGIYYCPHHPEIGAYPYRQACNCRKPGTGLLEQAALDLGVRLTDSYVVGDRISDLEAGRRVGAKLILVLTGHGAEERQKLFKDQGDNIIRPDHIAANLLEAVDWIIENVQTQTFACESIAKTQSES
jgi:lipopolysaccharide heptosyltransferase II